MRGRRHADDLRSQAGCQWHYLLHAPYASCVTTPSTAVHPDSELPGMPPSAKGDIGRVIGIVLLGMVVAILLVGVSGEFVYTPPTDCAEQIAGWSVDETSHVDPGCR